jgi:Protein of unknown function (DUF3419)
MKKLAIEKLDYEDVWQLFGEGKHPNFKQIFLTKLGPFMTEKSFMFWQKRCVLHHADVLSATLSWKHAPARMASATVGPASHIIAEWYANYGVILSVVLRGSRW